MQCWGTSSCFESIKTNGGLTLITKIVQLAMRYYNSNTKRCGWKNKDDLVRFANRFATDVWILRTSCVDEKNGRKDGLRGQRGLRVQGRRGVPMQETLIPGERFSFFRSNGY